MSDCIFLLACIGLCNILMYGTILNKIRYVITRINFFKELFACALCTGFWVGVVLSFTTGRDAVLLWGFASSGVCFLYDIICNAILQYAPHDK